MPRFSRRRSTRFRSNYSRGRRFRRYRRYGRSRLTSKFNKLALSGVTVRMRDQVVRTTSSFSAYTPTVGSGTHYLTNIITLPIVTGNAGALAAGTPLIANSAFYPYANIYDQFQLKWVNLKSVLISATFFPLRMHVSSDRLFNNPDDVPPVGSHPDRPASMSMQLNPNQYNRVNYFLSSTLMSEKIVWYDVTVAGAATSTGGPTAFGIGGFRPAYFIQFESTGALSEGITVSLQFEWKIRFRNPRLSGLAPVTVLGTSDVPVSLNDSFPPL